MMTTIVSTISPRCTTPLRKTLMSVALAVSSLGLVGGHSADAVSAACSSSKIYTGISWTHYSRTSCTRIGADTKVRSKLNIRLARDTHSSYFTSTYTSHDTSWGSCQWGCSATHELRSR
jgi:hypothetical protein